jgi:hypothetical protein
VASPRAWFVVLPCTTVVTTPSDWVTEHVHWSVDMGALGAGISAAEYANAAAAVVMASAMGKSPGHALGVIVMKRSTETSSPVHRR